MSDLTDFLRARVDEAEARAKRNSNGHGLDHTHAYTTDRYDPAHELREVEAKRAILAAWQEAKAAQKPYEPEYAYGIKDGRADALRDAVGHLAAVYRDHPDY